MSYDRSGVISSKQCIDDIDRVERLGGHRMKDITEYDPVRTAYHEAGHAIASYVLGVPFLKVSIISYGDYLGMVEHDKEGHDRCLDSITNGEIDYDNEALNMVCNKLTVYFSGRVAEEIYTGKQVEISGDDYEMAVDILFHMGYTDMNEQFYVYHEKAINLIKNNWPSVEAVATALLENKELSRKDIDGILRNKKA